MKTFTFLLLFLSGILSLNAQINYNEVVDGDLGPSMMDIFTIANGLNQWTGDLGPTLNSDADSWIVTVPNGGFVIDSIKYERGLIVGEVTFVWNSCLYADPISTSYKVEHTFDPPLGPGIYCVHIFTDDLDNENPVPWTVQVYVTGPEDPCAALGGDSDADGVCNDNDGCPDDPNKTNAGSCGCGVADTDSDGDTVADCIDGCPDDPAKTEPGVCGCGVADADSDNDTVEDCNDVCPGSDDLADADADLIPDGCDVCPNDPLNDADADGVCGDVDNCPTDANTDQSDLDLDGLGDVCDPILNIEGAGENLEDHVEDLNLTPGLENSLLTKIENAMAACANGNTQAAINILNAFINQVNAKRGNPLTDAQADELIAIAQAMIDAMANGTSDCGGNQPMVIMKDENVPSQEDLHHPAVVSEELLTARSQIEALSMTAYPNPGRGIITLEFEFPVKENVSVTIYNMYGEEISKLIDGKMYEKGGHTISWDARGMSGMFVALLQTESKSVPLQLVVLQD